jgi:hypothetical protein
MFERLVEMTGAFDKRHSNPAKNCGIHGMSLRFVLKGAKGAVQFVVYTPMHLPHVADELWHNKNRKYNPFKPMGIDIGYHSLVPQYEGQTVQQNNCEYCNGKPCYYDGSGLSAEAFMPQFLAEGSEAVWTMLAKRYDSMFGEDVC